MTKGAQLGIGIGLSLACLGLLLLQVNLQEVVAAVLAADLKSLLLSAVAYLICIFLRAWRWQILLGSQARFWSVLHAQNVGYLLTNLLPFRVGELGRALIIGQQPGLTSLQALSSVALERVLDMLFVMMLFSYGLWTVPTMPPLIREGALIFSLLAIVLFAVFFFAAYRRYFVLGLTGWIASRIPRLNIEVWLARTNSLLDGFQCLTQSRNRLLMLVLSVFIWSASAAAYYWGISAFWPHATWLMAVFTLCVACFGLAVPSSPSAIGVFHASVCLALSVFSVPNEKALGFAVVYHGYTFILILILGAFGVWRCNLTPEMFRGLRESHRRTGIPSITSEKASFPK